MKKPVLPLVLSLPAFYIVNRFVSFFESIPRAADPFERLNTTAEGFSAHIAAAPFAIGVSSSAIICGLGAVMILWFVWLYMVLSKKNFMAGQEHGSAKWATKNDIAPYIDRKNPDNNIILADQMMLRLKPKPDDFQHDRNKNITVVGGSGCGKTYSEILPNLMQLHSSYVLTDPKGTLQPDTVRLFINNGYEVRYFNTVNFAKSMHYNPLAYIRDEGDIAKLVDVFMQNTTGEGTSKGEDFWIKAERLWFTAIIAFLWTDARPEDRTFSMVAQLVGASEVKEEDESYQGAVDLLFEDLERRKPNCLAVKQYKKFKIAAGKTMKSILISCGARLGQFDLSNVREVTSDDQLSLDTLGDQKTILYITMSDTDTTYSWLIAMLFYQMFNLLCTKADDVYGGKLPIHVRCLLDEFANCGKIPNFEVLISTIRSRDISATIILQSLAQLDSIYEKKADTILDNCDTLIFLGGKSVKTTEQISKMIGKTTIDLRNVSQTRGGQGSYTLADQVVGRDLIDPAEIALLDRSECLVLLSNERPYKGRKYNTSHHPRFRQTAFGDKQQRMTADEIAEYREKLFFAHARIVEQVDLSELNILT